MVEAWTGVILVNPIEEIASRIHSASGGVRASQALGSFFSSSLGAILEVWPQAATNLSSKINFGLIAIGENDACLRVDKRHSASKEK